jgi:hypothetical protein
MFLRTFTLGLFTVSIAIAFVSAAWPQTRDFLPATPQPTTALLYTKVEQRAVAFGNDEKENTKKLSELAETGWEYVGPLNGTGMIAFRRSAVAAQRVNILGKWETGAGKDKCVVEFTKFGKMNVTGNPDVLSKLFEDIPAIIKLGGNLTALAYGLPDEGRLTFTIDHTKLELKPEKINELPFVQNALKEAPGGFGGNPGGFGGIPAGFGGNPGGFGGNPAGFGGNPGMPARATQFGTHLYKIDVDERMMTLSRRADNVLLKKAN